MTMYDPTQLSNLRDAYTNIISFNITNNLPSVSFQTNTQNGPLPYKFATRNSDGMPMYLYQVSLNSYRFVTFANAAGVCWYDITPEFDAWLDSNGSNLTQLNVVLSNGSFNYVYVTKKRGYKYTPGAYSILWAEHSQFWTEPDVSNVGNYMNSLYGYDIRVLHSAVFYTDLTKNSIKQYMLTGSTLQPAPVINNVYTSSDFTSISEINKPFFTFNIINNIPNISIQLPGEQGVIQYVSFNDGTKGYVSFLSNNQYKYITPDVSNYVAHVIIDASVSNWLANNYYNVFNTNIILQNNVYTQILILQKPSLLPQTTIFGLDTSNNQFWSVPNINSIHTWINSIQTYDIRFITDNNKWFTDLVGQGIIDYTKSVVALIPTIKDPVVINDNITNLIYTKSLYESSASYFDNVINNVQKEYTEELQLNNLLSSNSDILINDLQTFINTKSQEVHDKLVNLQKLNTNLQTILTSNNTAITNNTDLHNILISQPALNVSNEIIQLRDTIYSTLQFLANNNRLGTNNNVIYVINKTQI